MYKYLLIYNNNNKCPCFKKEGKNNNNKSIKWTRLLAIKNTLFLAADAKGLVMEVIEGLQCKCICVCLSCRLAIGSEEGLAVIDISWNKCLTLMGNHLSLLCTFCLCYQVGFHGYRDYRNFVITKFVSMVTTFISMVTKFVVMVAEFVSMVTTFVFVVTTSVSIVTEFVAMVTELLP